MTYAALFENARRIAYEYVPARLRIASLDLGGLRSLRPRERYSNAACRAVAFLLLWSIIPNWSIGSYFEKYDGAQTPIVAERLKWQWHNTSVRVVSSAAISDGRPSGPPEMECVGCTLVR